MEQFDFELKSRKICQSLSLFGIQAVVFTVFPYGNDFEIELVGSPGTVHFNFQKSVKSIFSTENSFKIESFVSDKLFRLTLSSFVSFDSTS